jgi:hypothetical protein
MSPPELRQTLPDLIRTRQDATAAALAAFLEIDAACQAAGAQVSGEGATGGE